MIDLSPLFGPADAVGAQPFDFRVFPKTGAERWLLETTQRRPWHLKTWPRANRRARLIYRVAWGLGALGLHLPFRVETYTVAPRSAYTQLRERFDRLGIFLGTPGPNRKIVVYAERPGQSVFIKIPLGPASIALAARESAALEELSQDPNLAHLVPRASRIAGHLALENIETDGTGYAALDLAELCRIQDLMESRSACTRQLAALRRDWEKDAPTGAVVTHNADVLAAILAARTAATGFLDGLPRGLEVPCYMAHGDFTRWNVLRAADGRARIIDWEFYGLKPRWFDLIHYVVSHDILVKRASAAMIIAHLKDVAKSTGRASPEHVWWSLVGLYFAYQSFFYCAVYERQESLHRQPIWQLKAWAEILRQLPKGKDPNIALSAECS